MNTPAVTGEWKLHIQLGNGSADPRKKEEAIDQRAAATPLTEHILIHFNGGHVAVFMLQNN